MKEYRVIIPEESYQILEFKQDLLPGIAVVNASLTSFEPKEVFSWHCSVMVELEDLMENGMPTREERVILDEYGDFLDSEIKGTQSDKPNALFLARITWNRSRELIWRVHDAEKTFQFLQQIIDQETHDRQFNFRIDPDPEWTLATWHLANC
ncbi:MAG: DUF695 domain-containing protein [Bacteroidota bacterium]